MWMTIIEIAVEYGVHPNTVRGWIRAGLPVQRRAVGRAYVVRRKDVDAFLTAREAAQ